MVEEARRCGVQHEVAATAASRTASSSLGKAGIGGAASVARRARIASRRRLTSSDTPIRAPASSTRPTSGSEKRPDEQARPGDQRIRPAPPDEGFESDVHEPAHAGEEQGEAHAQEKQGELESSATWLPRNAQESIEIAKTTDGNRRIAPRRSLRPRRRLRRAISADADGRDASRRIQTCAELFALLGSRPAPPGADAPGSGRARKDEPAAATDAASTRSGRSGRPGLLSTPQPRVLADEGGCHCGVGRL